MTETEKARAEKIRQLWDKAHGRWVPCFYWEKHPPMLYAYNAIRDTIDCECGIRVPIDVPTEELTIGKLGDLVEKLELKVFNEYLEQRGIDLGLPTYYD